MCEKQALDGVDGAIRHVDFDVIAFTASKVRVVGASTVINYRAGPLSYIVSQRFSPALCFLLG